MSNNVPKLRKVAICGLMAAFVFVATQIRIPTAIGYINLGDPVILISSFILGPIAFFPAAIGSALSDLLAGYAQYIIPTFIIKGLMGYVAGVSLRKFKITVHIRGSAFHVRSRGCRRIFVLQHDPGGCRCRHLRSRHIDPCD